MPSASPVKQGGPGFPEEPGEGHWGANAPSHLFLAVNKPAAHTRGQLKGIVLGSSSQEGIRWSLVLGSDPN